MTLKVNDAEIIDIAKQMEPIFVKNNWKWFIGKTKRTPNRYDIREQIIHLIKSLGSSNSDTTYVETGRIRVEKLEDGELAIQLIAETYYVKAKQEKDVVRQ